jgi:prophage DNA circulation protein
VSKSIDKKTAAFEFPDADGTYIQDLGHSGRRYPLRVFFWGADYDLQANVFEASLLERGTGKLSHPLYGTIDVVPFGTITRRDDLKTAANQAVIELEFWETTGLLYPVSQGDPASSVLSAVAEYNAAVAEEFAGAVTLGTAVERVTLRNDYMDLLGKAKGGLQVIANTQDSVRKQFNTIADSIDLGIDVLISEPLTLAFQTVLLIQTPGRVLEGIKARLAAYKDLADSIISGDGAAVSSNQFHARDLYASTYVSGSIVSTVNTQFTTKTDALAAADAVLTQMADVTAWRDENYQTLGQIDTGTSYQQLQDAVAITAGFLVDISFSLKQERRLVLDRPRTFIDLVAELYGATDAEYDFFIQSNDLSGDEIIELPRGREIVFYV